MKAGFSTITLVIADDIKQDVKVLAKRNGRCTSNYIKWLLTSAIERDKANSTWPYPLPRRPEDA